MAFGIPNRRKTETPIGMLAPKTWAELQEMDPYIQTHFPYAHESLAANRQLISCIRSQFRAALCYRNPNDDPNEELPKDEQDLATTMLKAMHIFQPPEPPTTMQRVTRAMVSYASRARAAVW